MSEKTNVKSMVPTRANFNFQDDTLAILDRVVLKQSLGTRTAGLRKAIRLLEVTCRPGVTVIVRDHATGKDTELVVL